MANSELAHGVSQFTRRRRAIMTGEEWLTPSATLYQVEVAPSGDKAAVLSTESEPPKRPRGVPEVHPGRASWWGARWSNRGPRGPLLAKSCVFSSGAPHAFWRSFSCRALGCHWTHSQKLRVLVRMCENPDGAPHFFRELPRRTKSWPWVAPWSNRLYTNIRYWTSAPPHRAPQPPDPPLEESRGERGRPPAPQARAGPVPVQRRLLNKSRATLPWGTLTVSCPRIAKPRIG